MTKNAAIGVLSGPLAVDSNLKSNVIVLEKGGKPGYAAKVAGHAAIAAGLFFISPVAGGMYLVASGSWGAAREKGASK